MPMNISLTPHLEEMIRAKIASGSYSASEVVREALRLLEEEDQLRSLKMQWLREDIREGLDSGPSTVSDPREMKRAAREKKLRRCKKYVSTTDLNENTYRQLLGRTLPHVIHTDEECERLTNELERLDERERLSPEERELAELLTVLIGEYEERRYPIQKASPRRTLQHLMEARNLTQKDLWKLFGSKGITSEVFHGKRAISKAQSRKLAEFFHVSVELFI